MISRSVRAGGHYSPIEDITLRAFGFYSKDDSADEEQAEDAESVQAGAVFEYRFWSWFSTIVRYNFIDQNALGVRGESYTDNRFTVGVVLSLPESLG